MILVDTSVWIDFFSSAPTRAGLELRRMIADADPLAITGVIVSEILQGLTRDVTRIEQYLLLWDMLEPAGFSTYREAAAIYRSARAKGISLTTIDTLIAAVALEHGVALFTLNKDFSRIATIVHLQLYTF
ncbi:MAG TPA: PIN domain nuclease [Candidatus Angelobacter sp.]|nr:PIN domain nuclease [Candidatus Angelobacter sp.]